MRAKPPVSDARPPHTLDFNTVPARISQRQAGTPRNAGRGNPSRNVAPGSGINLAPIFHSIRKAGGLPNSETPKWGQRFPAGGRACGRNPRYPTTVRHTPSISKPFQPGNRSASVPPRERGPRKSVKKCRPCFRDQSRAHLPIHPQGREACQTQRPRSGVKDSQPGVEHAGETPGIRRPVRHTPSISKPFQPGNNSSGVRSSARIERKRF